MAVETAFNVWNALFSLSGVIAGGYVGYRSASRISDRNSRSSACAKFRSAIAPAIVPAIAPAIAYLEAEESYSTPDHNRPKAGKFLFDNYFVHAAAIEEFRPFVRAKDPIHRN